ncbi:MAG TPA: hypothetical protein VL944_01300 [Candidatus Acidoferrum sp.]|nr:hypothetical protein [Candidatus Acidoferrum sp.]
MVRKPANIPDASRAEGPIFWGLTRSDSFDLATHVPVTRYGLRVLGDIPNSEIKLWMGSELKGAIRAERGQFTVLPDGDMMVKGRRVFLSVESDRNNGSSERHAYLGIVGERSAGIDAIAMRFANNVLGTTKAKLNSDIEEIFKMQREQGTIFPDYPGYLRSPNGGEAQESGAEKSET